MSASKEPGHRDARFSVLSALAGDESAHVTVEGVVESDGILEAIGTSAAVSLYGSRLVVVSVIADMPGSSRFVVEKMMDVRASQI